MVKRSIGTTERDDIIRQLQSILKKQRRKIQPRIILPHYREGDKCIQAYRCCDRNNANDEFSKELIRKHGEIRRNAAVGFSVEANIVDPGITLTAE